MKKYLLFSALILLLIVNASGVALGIPIAGVWTSSNTVAGTDFNGQVGMFIDGGDNELIIADQCTVANCDLEYWAVVGQMRNYMFEVEIKPDLDFFYVTRTGGTLLVNGKNLWGQEDGSMYTASVESMALGLTFRESGVFDHLIGYYRASGIFDEHPFSVELSGFLYLDRGVIECFDGAVLTGSLNHVKMTIAPAAPVAPVPEPATMLLLGTGLFGLAGFGRKKFFKK